MAILKRYRVPDAELGTRFTHWGTVHGWVPVYFSDPRAPGDLHLAVRNGYPDFLEPLGRWVYLIGELITELAFPDYESPGFRVEAFGRLSPRERD